MTSMTDKTGYVGTTIRMGVCYDCWDAIASCEDRWRLKYLHLTQNPEVEAFITASMGRAVIQDDERDGEILPYDGPCFFCGTTEDVLASFVTGDFRDWGFQ